MADVENTVGNPSSLDLTITEDPNSPIKDDLQATTGDEIIEPYKNGFGLTEYYKFCLKYYHKEKQIIKLSYDDKLQLTAYWKQVTSGRYDPDNVPDVGYFDVIGSDRRRVWESLGDMSKTEAMENFCILLEKCSPELKPWMEAQQKEAEEMKRKIQEEEEKKRKEMEEAAEKERQRLAEEEARRKAEEEERKKNRRNQKTRGTANAATAAATTATATSRTTASRWVTKNSSERSQPAGEICTIGQWSTSYPSSISLDKTKSRRVYPAC